MGNETDKSFTWVIKNFSSLQSQHTYSDPFIIGGCKWRILAYPMGARKNNCLSLYLNVAGSKFLSSGWRRHTKLSFTVVNQLSKELSKTKETQEWFDEKTTTFGFSTMLPVSKLHAKDGGFLVHGEVKIIAEIDVLEVIGKLDVSAEESRETAHPLKKIKLNGDVAVSSDLVIKTEQANETVDANGFPFLSTQVEYVNLIFERYPDFVSEVRPKKPCIRKMYMNVVLGLIETLCQLPEDLSDDDLDEASVALSYVVKGGFKVDWLTSKLEEVKETKKRVDTSKVRLQQIEEELWKLEKKCLELKELLGTEKAALLATNIPLSFDDVVR